MRKMLSLVLAMLLNVAMLPVSASAAEVNANEPNAVQYITIEEYEHALQEEGAKYGIACNVISYDPSVQLTTGMLENALENVRKYAESPKVSHAEVIYVERQKDDTLMPSSLMPVTEDFYQTFTVGNIWGTAEMKLRANITYNVQDYSVMNVNSAVAYQSGAYTNFVSWETTSITYRERYPDSRTVTFNVKGLSSFSFTDPNSFITTGYTDEEDVTLRITCK